ncbi:MAG: peptidylprolyl isomerase [Pontibacterium sp.]
MRSSYSQRLKATLVGAAIALSSSWAHSQTLLDGVAAVVNDSLVLTSEVDERVVQVQRDLRSKGQALPSDQVLREKVLDQLITEQVQLQAGERRGIRVNDRQLEAALNQVANNNNLTLVEFRNAVIAQGQDFDTVRANIERQLLLSNIQKTLVNQRIRISDKEVENYLNSEASQKQASLEMELSNLLVAVPAKASPATIRAAAKKAQSYYQRALAGENFASLATAHSDAQNALKGGTLGWRVVDKLPTNLADGIVKLKKGDISAPIQTPNGFYIFKVNDVRGETHLLVNQTRVRHILVAENAIRDAAQAQALIQEIKQRLGKGENFETLAQTYSDDPGSAADGGSLGWTQNGQMVAAFEQVMNQTDIGKVSAPFQSPFGWHILQVEDRRQQDLSEEKRLADANNTLRQRRYAEELNYWVRELRTDAYIDIKS